MKAKGLNVRNWAGADKSLCSFSPLAQGDVVEVCDAILSEDGKIWYYICYGGKYGFLNAAYVEYVSDVVLQFLGYLGTYHEYIKAHYKYFKYHYVSAINNGSFQTVIDMVTTKKVVGITCLVPISWALKTLGIKRKDGKSWVSGANGTFKSYYTGDFKNKFTRITKGDPIGMTVKQAVDAGLLKPGDIIAFEGVTHTFTYTGKGYIMYEGGHANGNYSKGIMPDYSKVYHKNRKISEILRWK